MKGNERYTVFMGVNMVSNIFFVFFWAINCDSNCSIGFFLVLDRCLIACSVEMYAKLLFEKKVRVFSLLFIFILTLHFNLMSLISIAFLLSCILPCVYTVTNMFIFFPLHFCQWPHCRKCK